MSGKTILVVDDEKSIRITLRMILEYSNYTVQEAANGTEALSSARKRRPDLVLLDIKMPGMDGMEVLESLHQDYPDLPIIILSGHGSVQTAVQAVKIGAFDFLEKPPQKDRILLSIQNALKLNQLIAQEKATFRDQPEFPVEMIGSSPNIQQLLSVIRKVAPSDLSVLVRGESGTGKELVAQMLHRLSNRNDAPFIQVNCAAIPEDLIENELFGHEKGSYSGASERRQGKFELAHNGTLFLDEIGDMSMKTQAKVLRALQEGEFQRVGGSRTLHANVRIIAATNQDLEEMIREGTFREDLYFRINVIPVFVPPLRERLDDLPALVTFFSAQFANRNQIIPATFSTAALNAMKKHPWIGNIRELKNVTERILLLTTEPEISAEQVSKSLTAGFSRRSPTESQPLPQFNTLQEFKEAAEKQFLLKKLEENNWNISATAESIGTPRSNLYKRMEHFGIQKQE